MFNKKFTIIISVIVALIVIGGIVVVLVVKKPEPANSVVQPINNTNNGSDVAREGDNNQKYKIDLSSDIDISNWPVFYNKALRYSIKYDPRYEWGSDDPMLATEDSPGATYRIYNRNSSSKFEIRKLTRKEPSMLDEWVNSLLENNIDVGRLKVFDQSKIIIDNNNTHAVLLEGVLSNTPDDLGSGELIPDPTYVIFSTFGTDYIWRIKFSSEYTNGDRALSKKSSDVFKAMVHTFMVDKN